MTDVNELTSPQQAQPVSPEQMSEEQLVGQIKAVQGEIAKAEAVQQAAVEQQVAGILLDQQNAALAQNANQAQPQTPTAQPAAQPAPEVTPAQPQAVPQTSFADLQNKTGVKNPDQLATNFVNLQRELTRKSQELAAMRKQQMSPMQQVPVQQPMVQQEQLPLPAENLMPQINDKFLQSLATAPVETTKALVEMVLEPYRQTLTELKLQNEVTRLSATVPDFNTDPIRGEMQRIISERYNEGYDITKNLEDVYWMAKGRIASTQAVQPQTANRPQPIVGQMLNKAVVEGQVKPQAPAPVDPKTMPLDELKKTIQDIQRQL